MESHMDVDVFVIMPYKDNFQTIYYNVLRRAIEKFGLTGTIAKDKWFTGPIDKKFSSLFRSLKFVLQI